MKLDEKRTTKGVRDAERSSEQRQRREGSIAVPPGSSAEVTTYDSTVPPHTLLLGSGTVSTRTHSILPKAPGLSISVCYWVTQ